MRNRDWSLVFFTTLSQASIGIILCFTLLGFIDNAPGLLTGRGLSPENPVFLALVFVGAATVVSFLHLGNPSNAPNAINNLAGSWVSREILALGIYAFCLVLIFILGWRGIEYTKYLLALASVTGLSLLLMMIRIYTITTIPPWNSWHTYTSFLSTALCLGTLVFLLLHFTGVVDIEDQTSTMMAIFLILILFAEIVSGFIHQSRLVKMNTGIDDLVFGNGAFYKVYLVRMVILITAFLVFAVISYRPGLVTTIGPWAWMYPIAVLVIAQEILGRLLFYSSYFRTGV